MTLKSDAKFEEKPTLGSKNNMRNLVNFNASTLSKSENLHFDVLLLPKLYYVWAKNVTLKNDANFEEEQTRDLKNDMRNEKFGELWPNTRKSQNLHFNGLLLIKV